MMVTLGTVTSHGSINPVAILSGRPRPTHPNLAHPAGPPCHYAVGCEPAVRNCRFTLRFFGKTAS